MLAQQRCSKVLCTQMKIAQTTVISRTPFVNIYIGNKSHPTEMLTLCLALRLLEWGIAQCWKCQRMTGQRARVSAHTHIHTRFSLKAHLTAVLPAKIILIPHFNKL